QVLATVLGLPVRRRPAPAQGTAREIDLFGRPERVGFYHTFAAYSRAARIAVPGLPGPVEVSRELATGEVYALRGPGLCSLQFHPESVLTSQGPAIVREALVRLTDGGPDE
ncbi:MAG TPA: chorismate-binding protein, partial [Rugosimonospora sp.]|nr:chorismate-binding protein [Rugosimonospora sp.]